MDPKKSRIVASIPMTEVDGVHGTLVVHFNPDATKEAPMSSNETPKPDPNGHTAITEIVDHGKHGDTGHGDDHGKHELPPKSEQGKGGGVPLPPSRPRPPRENDGGFPWWLWLLLALALLVGAGWLFSEDGCDGCNTPTPRPPVTVIGDGSGDPAPVLSGFSCPADIPPDLRGVWSPYCEVTSMSDEAATRRCGEIRATNRTGGRRCSELALYVYLVRTGHLVDAASTASSARVSELGQ